MEMTPIKRYSGVFLAGLLLTACASTDIETEDVYDGKAPPAKPDQVVVFDFAVSPDEVKLEHGLADDVMNLVDKTPRSAEEKKIGRAAADHLAETLVATLRDKSLPAVRSASVSTPGERRLLVKGQFLSIDQGNPTQRVVIGLGLGRSEVETRVQLYESVGGRQELLERVVAETRSGRKPGMAEMMGVGALLGTLVTATVASGGLAAASERLSANVTELSETMAKKIAAQIVDFYEKQGWI